MENDSVNSNEYMVLFGGHFQSPRNQEWINKSKKMLCKEAHLHHNEYSAIIKGIVHVSFPNLTFLHLSNNKITNIEALKNLNAPKLEKLHLSFNEFHIVKTLKKCYFPCLDKLSLMGTKIIDFDPLTEFNFPKLTTFIVEDTKDVNDVRLLNVNVLAKFHHRTDKLFSLRKERKSERVLNCILGRK